jgi:hypothetical protein
MGGNASRGCTAESSISENFESHIKVSFFTPTYIRPIISENLPVFYYEFLRRKKGYVEGKVPYFSRQKKVWL